MVKLWISEKNKSSEVPDLGKKGGVLDMVRKSGYWYMGKKRSSGKLNAGHNLQCSARFGEKTIR